MPDNGGFAPTADVPVSSTTDSPVPTDSHLMTPVERRASAALALVFALRMLGLFIVLPVFALEAARLPGGDDPARVGFAMGLYGLTQAFLQIPFGIASDRFGRKPTIVVGLLLFAAGSAIAAWAPDLTWLAIGRAVQGAGAISAAVTAFLADVTRDAVRTKAMALVGISIALMFALSLLLAPLLASWVGLSGIFFVTAILALLGIAVVVWGAPPEPLQQRLPSRGGLREVLTNAELLRVDLGVFVLHAVQIAMWMAVPGLLKEVGVASAEQWKVYLPTVLVSLLILGGFLFRLERRGYFKAVYLGAIALIALVQLGFLLSLQTPSLWLLAVLLCLYFVGFNAQEASQPSLASRLAEPHQRGAALGVYNTLMSLGIFAGGTLGGLVARHWGSAGIFSLSAGLMLLWLVLAWPMQARSPSVRG
jgi:MFS family permease